jgi:DNA-binding SARP family transcriptional activator
MLRIHLFGQLHVFDDDTLVRLRAPPKVVPLWAYLLLHRSVPVARDTLAAILWPDETEAHARANLRRHLYHLQRALPPAPPDRPWLLSDAETIRWNPTVDSWLDVAEFERLSQADDCLADAVALYAGDLLEHVYDDWLFYEREHLRAMYHASLDRLILRCRSERAYPQAISYTQQFLASDPLREDVVRQLIALRYEAGDRAGALQEYERFARLLRAELAVEPMPETVALYEAVARNARLPGGILAPAAPPETDKSVEQMTLAFVGREAELAELRVWWSRAARGRGGLALVGGEAGIGKTRLAEELARLVEAQGGRVLRGATMFTEPVPYQAIVDALRSALPLVAGLEIRPIWLAAVAPLLVDLKARRPDLPALAPLDPGRERAALRGSGALFRRAGTPAPAAVDPRRSALGRRGDRRLHRIFGPARRRPRATDPGHLPRGRNATCPPISRAAAADARGAPGEPPGTEPATSLGSSSTGRANSWPGHLHGRTGAAPVRRERRPPLVSERADQRAA